MGKGGTTMTECTDLYTTVENCELSAIELLGFIKNDIVDIKQIIVDIPQEYKDRLILAYSLINDVQEYLYNH